MANGRGKVETVTDFTFLGSKITVDSDCTHEIKRLLPLSGPEVTNLPPIQEFWVPSLGQEDPLEEGMATHSSILAWRIPRTKGPGGLQSMGSQESDTAERLNHHHPH